MKGSRRLRKAVGGLRRRITPGGVILIYHRVASLVDDPLALAVSPEHFAQQIAHISRTCQPMPLTDLVEAIQHGSLPRRAVSITFDDGYSDNYHNAYPILAAAHMPATIFVTSGMIDHKGEFWWDNLERILLQAPQLPTQLRLTIQGEVFEWTLDSAMNRRHAYGTLYRLLKPLPPRDRHEILQQLNSWADVPVAGRHPHRPMTQPELVDLSSNGLIQIGGHTQLHPQLSALSGREQQTEIVEGKRRLEQLTGRSVNVFAYPYGQTLDFTDETVEIVCAAGFRAALTTIHGYVESGEDVFRLRRCGVFDWEVGTFKQKLDEFFAIRS